MTKLRIIFKPRPIYQRNKAATWLLEELQEAPRQKAISNPVQNELEKVGFPFMIVRVAKTKVSANNFSQERFSYQ